MPHYYTITDGHGQGAEKIMWAEAALMQGQFSDTLIALENSLFTDRKKRAGEHGFMLRFPGTAAFSLH